MKVKNPFLLILLLNSLAYSQNMIVEYQQIFINSSIALDVKYDLYINDTISIYLEKESFKTSSEKSNSESNQTTYDLETNTKSNNNIYYNNQKLFLFKSTFYSNYLKVKEDSLNLNWKYIDSTKIIGNYNCKLATKQFRGRNYYDWYTEEIPTFFGPWKFYNLPGLIIQVYDEKREFEINALKINFSSLENIDENYNKTLVETSKSFNSGSQALTINDLKQFIKEKDELILSNINRQLPRGVVMPKIDVNCENCDKPLEIY